MSPNMWITLSLAVLLCVAGKSHTSNFLYFFMRGILLNIEIQLITKLRNILRILQGFR